MKKNIIAIIPAKGNSERVPNKNIQMLGGVPLIEWTLFDALHCKSIDSVYVSTNSDKVAACVNGYGGVISRPEKLCDSNTPSEDVVDHVLDNIKGIPDIIVMMQCTSPFRVPGVLDTAIEQFINNKSESLIFGYRLERFLWSINRTALNYDPFDRKMTQNAKFEQFIECGDYIFTRDCFVKYYNRVSKDVDRRMIFEVPYIHSIDIDTMSDLDRCRAYVKEFNLDPRT